MDHGLSDWAERLKSGRNIIPPPIFPEEAERALAVFRELKIVDAPGSPTIGEACAPWVFEIATSIFGAYDAESGRRLITEWFICVPKKNSKSTIAAAVMMTALILNWRQVGGIRRTGADDRSRRQCIQPARDMVKHDEELDALLQVQTTFPHDHAP